MNLSKPKLHKTLAVKSIVIQEKLMLRLTFNSGLALSVDAVAREKSICYNAAHVRFNWTKFGQYLKGANQYGKMHLN